MLVSQVSESVRGSAYLCDDVSRKTIQPIPVKLLHIIWMAIANNWLDLQVQQIQYGRPAAILFFPILLINYCRYPRRRVCCHKATFLFDIYALKVENKRKLCNRCEGAQWTGRPALILHRTEAHINLKYMSILKPMGMNVLWIYYAMITPGRNIIRNALTNTCAVIQSLKLVIYAVTFISTFQIW